MKKGLFITFEGVDGCGKSTQARMLYEHITGSGITAVFSRETGGCEISEQIRDIILNVANRSMSAHTEALLYAAARAQLVDEVILPALDKGYVVISDRFFDSSIAYQGFARELGADYILTLNEHAVKSCTPDATFFMDVDPDDAKQRMSKRQGTDRLESESELFFDRVYLGFSELAKKYPERYIAISACGSKYDTQEEIRRIFAEIYKKWQNS